MMPKNSYSRLRGHNVSPGQSEPPFSSFKTMANLHALAKTWIKSEQHRWEVEQLQDFDLFKNLFFETIYLQKWTNFLCPIFLSGLISIYSSIVTWFSFLSICTLWGNPDTHFTEVFQVMSKNKSTAW